MINIEIAPGELIDKLTILAIKLDRIADAPKRANVRLEHEVLDTARRAAIPACTQVDALTAELRTINENLWDIEDAIRDCERRGAFASEFVELARAVYKTNDRRAAVKKAINEHLGSRLTEEKSYHAY